MTPDPANSHLLYLDHAATMPLLAAAQGALERGYALWANPSSPHGAGRAARAALEDARERVKTALAWDGEVIFTSGATEALALAVTRCRLPLAAVSSVEHEAVLRHADSAAQLRVDESGQLDPRSAGFAGLVAVQHANNETGVVQPIAQIAEWVRRAGGLLLSDCAQTAGKIALPDADMIAVSAHKFGGPIGIGALLLRDFAMLVPTGGQERGYRSGTENMPGALAMAAALEQGNGWMAEAARLRGLLEEGMALMGGEIVAQQARRVATIGACRMPGVSAAAQLIRFDGMAIAVSAGSACSSGSLRLSHVLEAMRLDDKVMSQVIRVSIGRETTESDILRFLSAWSAIAWQGKAAA